MYKRTVPPFPAVLMSMMACGSTNQNVFIILPVGSTEVKEKSSVPSPLRPDSNNIIPKMPTRVYLARQHTKYMGGLLETHRL